MTASRIKSSTTYWAIAEVTLREQLLLLTRVLSSRHRQQRYTFNNHIGMRNYPVDRLLNRMTLMRNGRFYYITLSSSTIIINIPTQHLGGFGKPKSLSSREQIAVYLMSKPSSKVEITFLRPLKYLKIGQRGSINCIFLIYVILYLIKRDQMMLIPIIIIW